MLNISRPIKPSIDGELKVGRSLRSSLGLAPSGWTRKVVWYRSLTKNGTYSEIAGSEDKEIYTIVPSDMEGYLRVGVRYKKGILSTEEVYSDAVGPVVISDPGISQLTGKFYVGEEVSIAAGAAPLGWTLDVVWYRVYLKTEEIANSSTKYKIQKSDVFKQLQVKIRYRKNDGSQQTGWVFSDKSPTIEKGVPLAPLYLYPEDGKKTGITRDQLLSWTSTTDPDNSQMTYDVYLGHSSKSNMKKVATVDTNFYKPPSYLKRNEIYYWKVIAHDDDGYEAESVTQTFHTTRLLRKYNYPRVGWWWNPVSSIHFYPGQKDKFITTITRGSKAVAFDMQRFATDVKSEYAPATEITEITGGGQTQRDLYARGSALGPLVSMPTGYGFVTAKKNDLYFYSVSPSTGDMSFVFKQSGSPRRSVYTKVTRRSGSGYTWVYTTLARHGIRSVAIHPDGEYIAVGYEPEPFVEIYKYEGGSSLTKVKVLELSWLAHRIFSKGANARGLRVHTLKFSPSGDHLVVGDGITARLWNFKKMLDQGFPDKFASTRQINYTSETYDKNSGVAPSKFSDYRMYPQDVGRSHSSSVINTNPDYMPPRDWWTTGYFGYWQNPYSDALFIPSGISGTGKEELMTFGSYSHVFDAESGGFRKNVFRLPWSSLSPNFPPGKTNIPLRCGAVSSSGDFVAMASSNVEIRRFIPSTNYTAPYQLVYKLWSQARYNRLARYDMHFRGYITWEDRIVKVALSPDNKVLVAGDSSGRIFMWDMEGF